MPKRRPDRRTIGLGLIVVAFVPAALYATWVWLDVRQHPYKQPDEPVVFDQPVVLRKGEVRFPEFTVPVGRTYIVFLEFQQRMSAQRMECLAGWEQGDPEKCRRIPCVLDLWWAVSSKGKMIDADTSEHWWSHHWARYPRYTSIGTSIGFLKAAPGNSYALSIHFLDDPSELNITKPRVLIKALPLIYVPHGNLWDLVAFLFAIIWAGAFLLRALLVLTKREAEESPSGAQA
ncbi:MAG: hypothetical protein ABSH46_01780 [Bryobacteraceae bacterium]|jgi:hypothetical protein